VTRRLPAILLAAAVLAAAACAFSGEPDLAVLASGPLKSAFDSFCPDSRNGAPLVPFPKERVGSVQEIHNAVMGVPRTFESADAKTFVWAELPFGVPGSDIASVSVTTKPSGDPEVDIRDRNNKPVLPRRKPDVFQCKTDGAGKFLLLSCREEHRILFLRPEVAIRHLYVQIPKGKAPGAPAAYGPCVAPGEKSMIVRDIRTPEGLRACGWVETVAGKQPVDRTNRSPIPSSGARAGR